MVNQTRVKLNEKELNIKDLLKIKKDIQLLLIKSGEIAKSGYNSSKKNISTKKHENDYLTKYDIKINNLIVNHLKKNYPSFSIISEESPEIKGTNQYSWVIDPIDGTRNFIRKIPVFFSGIALIKNNKTCFCMTYNPISNELFWAIENYGAYLNKKKIKVSDKNKLLNSDIVFRSNIKNSLSMISKLHLNSYSIKNEMCCHFEISGIACSRFDVAILDGSNIWDYAQYLLIEEAGGKVTDFKGQNFDLSKKDLLGTNGLLHNDILKILK